MRAWVSAVAQRAAAQGADPLALLEAVEAVVARDPDAALRDFLQASLALVEDLAGQGDLVPHQAELTALCALARTALAADLDDRAILAREEALVAGAGPITFAATIPGRVVWLAAMVAQVPAEEGSAALMLMDDLAALRRDLPMLALRRTAGEDA